MSTNTDFDAIDSTHADPTQGVTYEWGVPACATTGNVVVDGETVEIDTEQSVTWYDRQWGPGAAPNWTWFELHVGDCSSEVDTKMSVWFFPGAAGTTKGFGTVRDSETGGYSVRPANITATGRSWTSSATNISYDLSWDVEFYDGTSLAINCPRDDNELRTDGNIMVTYEGYVEVNGTWANGSQLTGFGLVEIEPILQPTMAM